MEKVKLVHLESAVKRLNAINGFVKPSYSTVGAFVLDGSYGGYKLARIVNEGGGQTDISSGGYVSKRDLYNQVQAVLNVMMELKSWV